MSPRRLACVLALATVLPAGGCVTYPPGWSVEEKGRDPYQSVNRPIFSFNDGVDRWVLRPISKGWDFIMPDPVQRSLRKFFTNLQFPRRFLANLGQGELVHAGSELGRFLLNTTVGVVGLFDPATHLGMGFYDEDFGQMFGRWGIPAGPYWVLPILGASNPRDALGLPFDLFLDGRNAVTGLGVLATVNERALLDPQIQAARDAALDLYVFTRDGYISRREALVRNDAVTELVSPKTPIHDELYEIEDAELEGDTPGDPLYDVDEATGAGDGASDAVDEPGTGAEENDAAD